MPIDFLQSMYRRRRTQFDGVGKQAKQQRYSSMADELQKISEANGKLVGPKKKPHTLVETEPGSMHITKVGAPLLGAVPKLFRRVRSGVRAGVKTFRQAKGGPAAAKPVSTALVTKKPGVKKTPAKPSRVGKYIRAGMIGTGLAAGGAALGAGKILQQHAEQQRRGLVTPFYQ